MNDQKPDQNLRDLLERLHSELEQTESVDEKGNEMLGHLDTDIRALLQRSGRKKEPDEPVLERLQETIDHFEATHPSLTQTLSTPGGIWLAMKGKLPLNEMAELPPGFQTFHVERLEVPGLDAERCLIWIRKSAPYLPSHESGRLQ